MGKKPDQRLDGKPVSVTTGTLTPCYCTDFTLPRSLCPACKARRQRILARLRKRKDRERDGAALIPPGVAAELRRSLKAVNDLQLQLMDRLAIQGKQPRPDTVALFQHLAVIRAALTPSLNTANEESREIGRPRNETELNERTAERQRQQQRAASATARRRSG